MKKQLLTALVLLVAFNYGSAQDDKKKEKEVEMQEAPYDFLDAFDKSRRDKEMVRTNTKLLVAFGFNQALGDDNGIGEDYRFWGSGVFDLGLEFSTRLKADDDLLRFNYGLTLRTQTLRINNNEVFETLNRVTTLRNPLISLDRSRFSQVSLNFPMHIEIGRRTLKDYENGLKRYGGDKAFVVGLGGYLGFITSSSQSIEFQNEGRDVTLTNTNDFEVNDFQYGLSVYAGWNTMQIFATYGLSEIFDNSPVQQQYLSFGIRLR